MKTVSTDISSTPSKAAYLSEEVEIPTAQYDKIVKIAEAEGITVEEFVDRSLRLFFQKIEGMTEAEKLDYVQTLEDRTSAAAS